MKKVIIKILTLLMAFTSLFALTLFAGCDCGGNSGNGGYIPKPEAPVERILKIDATVLNMIVGDEHTFSATYKKEEGKTLTYASSNPDVASVTPTGELVAMSEGNATITATYGDLTAECVVGVSFGNYIPELAFESGLLDVYDIGLDGVPYTFSPVVKFNNKIFTDVEATFVSANENIAKFENSSVKGLALGETTATITVSWRGWTIESAPALQKIVKIKTHNVANFLINDRVYDVFQLSSFDGEFAGTTYSNNEDFNLKLLYNGQVLETNDIKVDIEDTSTVVLQGGKLIAKEAGRTNVTLTYKDSANEVFTTSFVVEVVRPIADSGKKYYYFSAAHGYYKDVTQNYANKSVLREIFGSDYTSVIDAYTVDGIKLRIDGDKILNVPGQNEQSVVNTVVLGTSTYAYTVELETYGAIIADKNDLQVLNVTYKFDKAKFDAMPDATLKQKAAKVAYLEECAIDPFTYIDGYSILLNDIDATGVTITHDAIASVPTKTIYYKDSAGKDGSYVFVNGEVGFLANETANKYVALNPDAPIVYEGKAYNIPRAGYPLVGRFLTVEDNETSPNGKVYGMVKPGITSSYFSKIGLLGVFDGQGHIISNFTSDETKISFKNGTEDSVSIRNGAGLFGVVNAGASVRNVAVNKFLGKGSVFAYIDQSPSGSGSSGHNYNGGDVWDVKNYYGTKQQSITRTTFENIYINSDVEEVYGLLYRDSGGSRGATFKNILINLPCVKEGGLHGNNQWDTTTTAILGGGVNFSQTNNSLYYVVNNVYVAISGKHTFAPIITGQTLVVASSLKELYSKKESLVIYQSEGATNRCQTIAVAFENNSFWGSVDLDGSGKASDGDAVFWNGLFGYSYYDLTQTNVELSKDVTSVLVGLTDIYGIAVNPSKYQVIFSNPDALKYENGAIKVNTYIAGNFTATFVVDGAKLIVPVSVEITEDQTAYLSQIDGEIVFPYLKANEIEAFDGATIDVDGVKATGRVEDGKFYIDLADIGLDANEILKGYTYKYASIDTGSKKHYYALKYVTKAIDEAEDLNFFNVTYKFNQEYFNSLTATADKVDYLEACEKDPFTYFDGYYVLIKDIDATGITFNHEAILAGIAQKTVNYTGAEGAASYSFFDGEIGFIANETTNKFVALNPSAVINFNGKDYNIPRAGYPLVGSCTSIVDDATSDNGKVYNGVTSMTSAFFAKSGLLGTFDGQGYVISNLTSDVTTIEFLNGDTKTSATRNGAGIFGMINGGSKIVNVAVNGFNGKGSAFAFVDQTPSEYSVEVKGNRYSDKDIWDANNFYGTDPQSHNRTLFENIYVYSNTEVAYGILYGYSLAARSGDFRNIFIYLPGIKETGGLKGNNQWDKEVTAVLGGSVNFNQANYTLKPVVKNAYVVLPGEYSFSLILNEHGFVRANKLADIFAMNKTITGQDQVTMAEAFADNPYWMITDTNGYGIGAGDTVSWKRLGLPLEISKSSVKFNAEEREVSVTLTLAGAPVNPESVEFNVDNVFTYSNGTLKMTNFVPGYYEATFTYKGVEMVLPITVFADERTGYLSQVDGEIVEHGLKANELEALDGANVKIDGKETTASVVDGKLYIDLSTTGLQSEVLVEAGEKIATFISDSTVFGFTLTYVTKAIDEAEDLTYFNVGYRFDEAYYNTLDDAGKMDYLAEIEASPFDYYEGYYVLVKDIDAKDVKFNHEAIVAPTTTVVEEVTVAQYGFDVVTTKNGNVQSTKFDASKSANASQAQIVINGTTYNVPRAGFPVLNNMQALMDKKVGFRGTFDGQGYKIFNLNKATRDVVSYNTESGTAEAQAIGAGLFGAIQRSAKITNVAFFDMNVGNSAGLAMYLADGGASSRYSDNGVTTDGSRLTIYNVFIKTARSDNNYGIIASKNSGNAPVRFEFVVVDAASHKAMAASGTGLTGGMFGGDYQYGNNTTNMSIARYAFISMQDKAHELVVGGTTWGTNKEHNFNAITPPETLGKDGYKLKDLPLTYKELCESVDWAGTAGDTSDDITMVDAFTTDVDFRNNTHNLSAYWSKIGNGVYWNGISEYYTGFDKNEIELSLEETTAELVLTDATGGVLSPEKVTVSNEDVLKYENGVISYKTYKPGTYEVVFTYNGKDYAINVNIAYIKRTAYLSQVDGEILEHGFSTSEVESFDDASVRIDGKETTASVVDGKLYIDLSTTGLQSEVLTAVSEMTATIENDVTGYSFDFKYVTKAIDEAEDLTYFNVGYRFDEAYYNTLDDAGKRDYLAEIEASPFDYYEGYYVLLKDIDAKDVKFNHEAIVAPTTTVVEEVTVAQYGFNVVGTKNGYVYSTKFDASKSANASQAQIVINGTTYNVPRAGFPVLNNMQALMDKKVGFRGTFDGQGYTIFNLNKATRDVVSYNTESGTAEAQAIGAGLFGAIQRSAKITNVAFFDMNVGNSAGLAMYLADGGASSLYSDNGVTTAGSRLTIYNVFIKTATSDNNYGIITSKNSGNAPVRFEFVVVDAPSHKAMAASGTGLTGGMFGGDYQYGNNTTNMSIARYAFISMQDKAHELVVGGTTWGTNKEHNFNAITPPETLGKDGYKLKGLPLTYKELCESVDWAGTAGDTSDDITMVDAFTTDVDFRNNTHNLSAYWSKIGNGVYWNGLVYKYISLGAEEVELTVDDNSVVAGLVEAAGGYVEADKVTISNTDVLEYVDGKIAYKSYKPGKYEVTFTYNGKDYTVEVTIANIKKNAYLSQVDGEIVNVGLEGAELSALDGATVTIGDKETTASVVDGKLYIDNLEAIGISKTEVLKAIGEKVVTIDTDTIDYDYTLKFVTLAIDEANDLKHFNVGYKFNETYYNTLDDPGKMDYLAKIEASPFDYYEGYYVLVKDIDAKDVKFNHEAVVAPTITDAGVTGSATGFTAVAGNIAVPRAGYPVNNGFTSITGVKVGFRGTFDGQGHIIYNLNQTKRDVVKYVKADDSEGSTYDVGAGLFGVIGLNSKIQNVAFYDMNVGNSGGLSMYVAGTKKIGTAAIIHNVFIKTATSDNNYGVISSSAGSGNGLSISFVVIDASSHKAMAASDSGLTGGIQGGDYKYGNNPSQVSTARYAFVSAENNAQELYVNGTTYGSNTTHNYALITPPETLGKDGYKLKGLPLTYKDLCTAVDWAGTVQGNAAEGVDATADDISMVDAFTTDVLWNKTTYNFSQYWTKIDNGVYWNGLADKYIS